MPEPLKFTLPIGPSANRYWRHYQGIMRRSQQAIDYIALVAGTLRAAGVKPFEGDVSLTVVIYREKRAGDIENRVKVLADALQGFAYHDDAQIAELHVYRHDGPQGTTKAAKQAKAEYKPRVEVMVSPVLTRGASA